MQWCTGVSPAPVPNKSGRDARAPIILLVAVLFNSFLHAAPTAEEMRTFLRQRPEQDMIHWKDPARGDSLEVRVVEITDTGVRVQKTLQSGFADRVLPKAEIARIDFARTSTERRLIQQPSPAAIPALKLLWEHRRPAIKMGNTSSASIALALAKANRMRDVDEGFAEAETLLNTLAEIDLGENLSTAISRERHTLKLARALHTGPPEETDRIAWAATEADPGADAMILATSWLANRHFEDLQKLEKENPRWELDDEIRPLRARLYHLALDFALYPSLFHGTRHEEAAAGLAKTWQVHDFTKAPELALQTLEDLAALYPETTAAQETADELARLRILRDQGNLVPEPEGTTTEEDPESTTDPDPESQETNTPPPTPKRYNLFDD
jgi:hypothetical protein